MTEVIGVRFKSSGKVYFFDPAGQPYAKGERVIVETARGVECGEVMNPNYSVEDGRIVKPLRKLIRKATAEDIQKATENRHREAEAIAICEKKILEHKLDMKLVEAEYSFDGSKLTFYFTSDGRVDFRSLVKDLASAFHIRIELRQIGVRDEAKMLGGLGICGQPFCCSRFLDEFQPVSIKMAKEQGLSLNPVKISGTCGRLMCCLKYEQDAYEHLLKITPKTGALVKAPDGKGHVVDANMLTGAVKVQLNDEMVPRVYARNDIKVIRDGHIKVEKSEKEAFKGLEK